MSGFTSRYLSVNANVQEEKCCEWNYCMHNEVEVGQIITNVDFIHPQTRSLKTVNSAKKRLLVI